MQTKYIAMLAAGVTAATVGGIAVGLRQTQPPASPPPSPSEVITSASPTLTPSVTPSPEIPTPRSPSGTQPESSAPPSPVLTPSSPTAPVQPGPVTHATRQTKECEIKMAKIADPNPPLNVRSEPDSSSSAVGQLTNGTFVTIVDQQSGWFQIESPVKGWISRDRTENSCSQKTERVWFAPGTDSTTIADRFIGTGSHRYIVEANKGQTLTVTVQEGQMPMVLNPSGQTMNEASAQSQNSTWSVELPAKGNYTLVMDSNFRGYDYKFSVQIR